MANHFRTMSARCESAINVISFGQDLPNVIELGPKAGRRLPSADSPIPSAATQPFLRQQKHKERTPGACSIKSVILSAVIRLTINRTSLREVTGRTALTPPRSTSAIFRAASTFRRNDPNIKPWDRSPAHFILRSGDGKNYNQFDLQFMHFGFDSSIEYRYNLIITLPCKPNYYAMRESRSHFLHLRKGVTPRPPIDCLRDCQGVAVIEMAITLPLLLTLLFGIMTYGQWFFVSHTVQQAANDAARATLSGLSKDERRATALKTVSASFQRGSTLDASKVTVLVEDDGQTIVVRLSYDAAADPLLSTGLVPLPSKTISRSAAVLLGGV